VRGAELTPEMVWAGYSQGYFPMTVFGDEVEWLRPHRRALFPPTGIHVSESLKKTLRQRRYEIRFDTSFEQVMLACMRPGDNWISEEFVRVYGEVHRQGWAHCCEAWGEEGLVGGVYGIAIGSCFCAESMFHRSTDAGKVALHALVERCRELEFTVFDAQVMNPHLASLGAFEVDHEEYMALLKMALTQTTEWSLPGPPSLQRT